MAAPHPAPPSNFTEAATLFERFDHLLSLADRCPRSAAADRLRRSVHDSIEAGSLADRRKHLARVLDELDVMRRHHGSGPGVAAGSLITAEPLLAALHAAVVSILAPES
jgi:hypothetical protein